MDLSKRVHQRERNVWASEISHDSFFFLLLSTHTHMHTYTWTYTLWVIVLVRGDTRRECKYEWERDRECYCERVCKATHRLNSNEWTHSFRFRKLYVHHSSVDQRFSNQYRIRIQTVRFYILIHSPSFIVFDCVRTRFTVISIVQSNILYSWFHYFVDFTVTRFPIVIFTVSVSKIQRIFFLFCFTPLVQLPIGIIFFFLSLSLLLHKIQSGVVTMWIS